MRLICGAEVYVVATDPYLWLPSEHLIITVCFFLFPTYEPCFRGPESKEKAVGGKKKPKKQTEDITASLPQLVQTGSVSLKPALMVLMTFLTLHSVLILAIPYKKEDVFFFFPSNNKPWLTKELINKQKKIFLLTGVSSDRKAVSEEVRAEFAKFKSTHKSKIEE